MPFTRPTLQQIVDRIAGDFVSKIVGSTTLAMRSVLMVMARVYAGAVHLLYGYLDNMSKELFAKTASGDANGGKLDTIGSEYGVFRKAATAATGTVQCTGSGGTIPAGTGYTSPIGNRYVTNNVTSVVASVTSSFTVTCDTAGAAGDDVAGVVLSIESSIVGVNSTATVDSNALTNGADVETDDDYRTRILSRKQTTPQGGSEQDLINWALEYMGVTRAWAYPLFQGAGTVAVYFVCDSQIPILPTQSQADGVAAYLKSHVDDKGRVVGIPVTMLPGLAVAAPVISVMNFTINLSPNTATTQAEVTAQLTNLLYRKAYPGGTLYLSDIQSAIMAAAGVNHCAVVYPAADVALAHNGIGQLGSITWQDY